MTAYEELKAWCRKHGIEYSEWESEWTGNPCFSLSGSEETWVFYKDGSFSHIDQRKKVPQTA